MYITANDQREMIKLMNEYRTETAGGEIRTPIGDRIMSRFYDYADKIILGIINKYQFHKYAELDDLKQEARIAVHSSIVKQQYDQSKGSIFNFISLVAQRGLVNYTKKLNKNIDKKSAVDIDLFYNNRTLTYYQDFDKNIILDDLKVILLDYFSGQARLEELTILLIRYFETHRSSRFIKKHFIEYARAYNFSSAMVNTFFDKISRGKYKNEISDFLETIESDNKENSKIFDIK